MLHCWWNFAPPATQGLKILFFYFFKCYRSCKIVMGKWFTHVLTHSLFTHALWHGDVLLSVYNAGTKRYENKPSFSKVINPKSAQTSEIRIRFVAHAFTADNNYSIPYLLKNNVIKTPLSPVFLFVLAALVGGFPAD